MVLANITGFDVYHVFSCVFNFCTRANNDDVAAISGASALRARRNNVAVPISSGAEFIGSELYERLKDFITQFATYLLNVRISFWY